LKDQWLESNVDLGLLSESVERFFVENKFDAKLERSGSGFRIEAVNPAFRVKVRIFGVPGDFAVEFVPSKKSRGFSSIGMMLAYVASAFGGGGLVLMDTKVQEAVGVFEALFWDYVDKQVAELRDSARVKAEG
jgi:hypothetical protein